jgi:Transposase Tn5 dimerisation domain
MQLKTHLPQLKRLGSYTLSLRARPEQAAREVELEVRIGQVKIPRPRHVSPWVRELNKGPIAMNVIDVVEVNPPKGIEPIRWVLLTSLPVTTFEEAWVVIGYYELRWLVEEYHKTLKTGCRTESRQLKTADRLEAFVGLTSVLAVRLLQLKSIARTNPDIPAQRVIPAVWLKMLKIASKNLTRVHDLTVGQFYREVAKLGGFLGRKGDGDPGWITIWRGWQKLNMYVIVASRLKSTG